MKKIALALCISAITPFAAHADLLFTVGAKASIWNADPSGQVDDGISVDDDENGFGLDAENGTQLTVFVEHPVPFIPNLRIRNTSLDLSGKGRFISPVVFNDETFVAGPVNTEIDLSHTDYTAYWGLPLPLPYIDINLGATARAFDGSAVIETAAQREDVDLNFVLPMAFAEAKVGSPFGVYGQLEVNYAGDVTTDISYAVGYDLPIAIADLGVEVGYRSMSMKTDKDQTDVDVDVDVDVSGIFYGVSASIGF